MKKFITNQLIFIFFCKQYGGYIYLAIMLNHSKYILIIMLKDVNLNEPMNLTLKNDYAFKRIFGKEENKDILSAFICLVTEMNEEDFEELLIEKEDILNIRINFKNGQDAKIVMNLLRGENPEERTIIYWANMYYEDFNKSFGYDYPNKYIFINIVNRNFLTNNKLHSVYKMLETEKYTNFSDLLEIHFLNLRQIPTEKRNVLEDWLLFIETEQEEVRNMLAEKNPLLKKVNKQIKEFFNIEKNKELYLEAEKSSSDL